MYATGRRGAECALNVYVSKLTVWVDVCVCVCECVCVTRKLQGKEGIKIEVFCECD